MILCLLTLIISISFQIIPKINRVRAKLYPQENHSFVSTMQWFTSKKGFSEFLIDKKKYPILHRNSFFVFNLCWKILVVLLTFRVLVVFFAQDIV